VCFVMQVFHFFSCCVFLFWFRVVCLVLCSFRCRFVWRSCLFVCLFVCMYVFVRCRSCSCVAVPRSVFSFVLGMLAFLLLCFAFVSVPFVCLPLFSCCFRLLLSTVCCCWFLALWGVLVCLSSSLSLSVCLCVCVVIE